MTVHLAYSVVSPTIGVVKMKAELSAASLYQPAKVLPVLVGAVGNVAVVL